MPNNPTFRNEQVAAPLKGHADSYLAVEVTVFPQRTSCGPIEGSYTCDCYSSCEAFRNEQVAAPLKASSLIWISSCLMMSFRNEQVAAPLKDLRGGYSGGGQIHFPQRTSCGPIEGGEQPIAADPALNFPQRTSCGPIEGPTRSVRDPPVPPGFPQRTSCGPIEGSIRVQYGGSRPMLSATNKLRPH